jgi:hypothetical protein
MSPARPSPDDDPRPLPPRAPEPGECCQSGCEPCIYDMYWDAIERYEQALQAWEARHASRGER